MIDRDEEAEAEVGAVAESKGALHFLIELDGQADPRLMPALSVAMVAFGLELESAQGPLRADGDRSVGLREGFGCQSTILLQQTAQVLGWRSNRPAVFVKFRASVRVVLSVARWNKGSKRGPAFGFAEDGDVESFHIAEPQKEKFEVVTAVAPECLALNLFDDLLRIMIKAHRRIERDVADGVTLFAKLAKDVRVLMTFERLSVGFFADENTCARLTVRTFGERLVHSFSDGNGLSNAW